MPLLDNTSFLKFLERKEGSLKELSGLLYPDKEDLNFKTVYELVEVYEDENGKILLHKWKEIFEDLGYMEDFRAMFPLSLSATGVQDIRIRVKHKSSDVIIRVYVALRSSAYSLDVQV